MTLKEALRNCKRIRRKGWVEYALMNAEKGTIFISDAISDDWEVEFEEERLITLSAPERFAYACWGYSGEERNRNANYFWETLKKK